MSGEGREDDKERVKGTKVKECWMRRMRKESVVRGKERVQRRKKKAEDREVCWER